MDRIGLCGTIGRASFARTDLHGLSGVTDDTGLLDAADLSVTECTSGAGINFPVRLTGDVVFCAQGHGAALGNGVHGVRDRVCFATYRNIGRDGAQIPVARPARVDGRHRSVDEVTA